MTAIEPTQLETPRNLDINTLQTSIRALVKERRELQTRLGNHDFKGRANFVASNRGDQKRSRQPTTSNTEGTIEETTTEQANEGKRLDFPVEKRPKISLDDSTVKRTKNMFGSLLGHLQKAKSRLDMEKTQRPHELQRVATEHVDHLLKLERKNLAELRKRDFLERQKRDIQRMKELQQELRHKETQILLEEPVYCYEKLHSYQCGFSASPMIFWLPVKDNEVTRELRKVTAEEIDGKLERLNEKFSNLTEESWPTMSQTELDAILPPNESNEVDETTLIPPATMHPDLINDDSDDEEDDEQQPKVTEDVPSEGMDVDNS